MATPTTSRLRTPESSRKAVSARDERHLKLLQSREKIEKSRSEVATDGTDEDEGDDAEDDSAGLTTATLDGEIIEMDSSISSGSDERDGGVQRPFSNMSSSGVITKGRKSRSGASETSHAEIESKDGTEKGGRAIDGDLSNVSKSIPHDLGGSGTDRTDAVDDEVARDEDAESPSSGGSSGSDSDSSSNSDSDSDSDTSDSEDEDGADSDEEDERLEKLLQAARISALEKQQGKSDHKQSAADSEVVLQFDEEKKSA